MSLHEALRDACAAVGIQPPKRQPVPGRWTRTDTTERNGRGDAEVLIDGDRVSVVNWQTGERKTVRLNGEVSGTAPRRRDPEADRREQEEREAVAGVCNLIVNTAQQAVHPYLDRKGFPQEIGLVHEAPWRHFPQGKLGEALTRAMPAGDSPWLIVPGRIGQRVTTVQFIGPDGSKKNILKGAMSGASHRIATGRETLVCEGIATAMSVRAALRMLGRSATVLSAFSASNVAKVASRIPGAIIAADHDKPQDQLHGKGAGEFYAAASGCRWVMPPELGDWNDHHQAHGLRSVAMLLREAVPP